MSAFWKNLFNKADYTNNFWKNVSIAFNKVKDGFFGSAVGKGVSNLWRSATGSGLTDAQREANAFTAEQNQKAMDFEQSMSSSAFQRQVSDMKSAGVNPALAMGGTSNGASTASGSAGSSVSPSSDPVGLLGMLTQISLLRSQKRNIDSQTDKNLSEVDVNKQKAINLSKELSEIGARVNNLNLDAEYKTVINRYIDDIQLATLSQIQSSDFLMQRQAEETNRKIMKLDSDEKLVLQHIAESQERVLNLAKERELNDEQIKEIKENVDYIKQARYNLIKEGKLLDKEINWYVHDKIASDVGKVGGLAVNAIGLGKVGRVARSVASGGRRSSPVDLTGYGAYGSYD